jgi:hypothetical protein
MAKAKPKSKLTRLTRAKAILPIKVRTKGLRPQSKTSKERITRAKRGTQFMKLRIEGLSFEEIGAQMGVSTQRAFKIIKDELALLNRKRAETAEECIRLELSRLDDMLKPLWAKCKAGDIGAQAAVLRLMDRRAKLLGLDFSDRKENSGSGNIVLNFEEVIVNGKATGRVETADRATQSPARLLEE